MKWRQRFARKSRLRAFGLSPHPRACQNYRAPYLGLAPQALCFRLLRRLRIYRVANTFNESPKRLTLSTPLMIFFNARRGRLFIKDSFNW